MFCIIITVNLLFCPTQPFLLSRTVASPSAYSLTLPTPLSYPAKPAIFSSFVLLLNTQVGLDFLLKVRQSVKIFDQVGTMMQTYQKGKESRYSD